MGGVAVKSAVHGLVEEFAGPRSRVGASGGISYTAVTAVPRGFVVVSAPRVAAKSPLLRALAGLETPSAGTVDVRRGAGAAA